jgi:hypothetical protein
MLFRDDPDAEAIFPRNFPSNREFESLSGDGLSPDQTAGGAPPLGLGRGEGGARLLGRTPIGE